MIEMIFFILLILNVTVLLIGSVLFSVGFVGFVLMIANTNTSEMRFEK